MMDALEVAGKILDLPALVGADLLALDAAAGASTLLCAQLVDLGSDRKIFEVGKVPPTLAPLHPPQFFFRFRIARKIVGMNRLAVQLLGEGEKHLRQIVVRLQAVRARPVVPLLVPVQLQLQAKVLNL